MTCTGIDVAAIVVSLLISEEELFVEAKGGGLNMGERGAEPGFGLVGFEDNVDADDNDNEASILEGLFFVSSWNKPPVANFFPPCDGT